MPYVGPTGIKGECSGCVGPTGSSRPRVMVQSVFDATEFYVGPTGLELG